MKSSAKAFNLGVLVMTAAFIAGAATGPRAQAGALADFDKTTQLVTDKFYDRTMRGLPWAQLVADTRAQISDATPPAEMAAKLNGLLGQLHAAPTEFLLATEPRYWALQSAFSGAIDGAPTCQMGAYFEPRDGHWFIAALLDSSAVKAGFLPGDEIVTPEFEPIQSLCARAPTLLVRRNPALPAWEMTAPTTRASFQRSFYNASVASRAVLQSGDQSVGYFHLWAGTHDDFKSALSSAVLGLSRAVNAFVLDLRGGVGGPATSDSASYLDVFTSGYSGPLVAIIDERTAGGKEALAYLLKQRKRATLVGTRTAGAYLVGQTFEIAVGQSVLYLAVDKPAPLAPPLPSNDPLAPIEGQGVEPDIVVEMDLRYSQGEDPQLVKALKTAAALGRSH